MKKLNHVASLISLAVLSVGAVAQTNDNWMNPTGLTWKDGAGQHCWRTANWTPATAKAGCDGAIKSAPPAPPPVAAKATPTPPPVAAPAASSAAAPTSEKVTFAADAFFDFDKADLKSEGKAKLDDMASKIGGIDLEVIVSVGHTDSVGSNEYNQALSLRRAEAVKAYLISKGIDKSKVFTEGKGEAQPAADNATAQGRAMNRRVVIETVGKTRTAK